jgi:hypothetical protein
MPQKTIFCTISEAINSQRMARDVIAALDHAGYTIITKSTDMMTKFDEEFALRFAPENEVEKDARWPSDKV